jgi:signal transduction histidine kinase
VGLDRDWVDAGPRRTAYYSHVPPGRYIFKVIAANSDGVWNTNGKSLPIIVLPAFYQTWWFLTLASLIAAGAVIFAWRYRVTQLEGAHAVQQAFSRQLIASQEAERERVAAELHDSLGQSLLIIKNRAVLARNSFDDAEAAREQLDEISAAASHAVGEVREISYNLRPYQLDRFGLTKTLQAACDRASKSSGICFLTELDTIDGLFSKETEINIYRIVQEAINNILKHSQATEAALTVRRRGGEVCLTVRDSGQGFSSVALNTGAAAPGGFGLFGMAERVRMLGGTYDVASAPREGTTVTIRLAILGGANGQ